MIDLNDRFTGLMIVLLTILALSAYVAFFTEREDLPAGRQGQKSSSKSRR